MGSKVEGQVAASHPALFSVKLQRIALHCKDKGIRVGCDTRWGGGERGKKNHTLRLPPLTISCLCHHTARSIQ